MSDYNKGYEKLEAAEKEIARLKAQLAEEQNLSEVRRKTIAALSDVDIAKGKYIEELRAQLSLLQWTAIEEGNLPKVGQYVLVCGGRLLKFAHPARVLKGKAGIEFWWAFNKLSPTHWMPMINPPAPPTDKEQK